MIVQFLTHFSTLFKLYRSGHSTYQCFPGILFTSAPHNILFKPLAAFPHNIVDTMESGERGMNPVAMTIISPRKEFWSRWRFEPATSCLLQVFYANRLGGKRVDFVITKRLKCIILFTMKTF